MNQIFLFSGLFLFSILYNSCSDFRTSVYLLLIDNKTGPEFIQEEPKIKVLLNDVLDSYEEYTMKVFARTPLKGQSKRSKLMTHCYYVIFQKDEKYHTLSFYGSDMTFKSKGVWVLDSDSDFVSCTLYLEGKNKWDTTEVYQGKIIDVRRTTANILNKLDKQMTYYYRDHVKNKPNMDNCNTALYETIVFKE